MKPAKVASRPDRNSSDEDSDYQETSNSAAKKDSKSAAKDDSKPPAKPAAVAKSTDTDSDDDDIIFVGTSSTRGTSVNWQDWDTLKSQFERAAGIDVPKRFESSRPKTLKSSFLKKLALILSYCHVKGGAPKSRFILQANDKDVPTITAKMKELWALSVDLADVPMPAAPFRIGGDYENLIGQYKVGKWTEGDPKRNIDVTKSRHPIYGPHAEILESIGMISPE